MQKSTWSSKGISKNSKSQQSKKANPTSIINRITRSAKTKVIVTMLFIISFGAYGTMMLLPSSASTYDLGQVQCKLRGREYLDSSGLCTDKCIDDSGTLLTDARYGYCSKAVTRSLSEDECHSIGRRYVTYTGCSKRWQGDNKAPLAIQCLNTSSSYIVTSNYDYCTGYPQYPTTSSPSIVTGWVWPVKDHDISLDWGVNGSRGVHKGIDMPGGGEGTSVYAAHSGKVMSAAYPACGGEYVISVLGQSGIYHGYQHMKNLKYRVGDYVNAGDYIGQVGPKNGCSSGPHLHFSVEKRAQVTTYAEALSNTYNPHNYLK